MLSEQVLRTCALFGILPGRDDDGELRRRRAASTASELLKLPPGKIALITGPSGGGKSLIVRALARAAGARRLVVDAMRLGRGHARVIDLLGGPVGERLSLLARVGLGEAHIMAGEVRTLSDGQRFRLALALALSRARCTHRRRPLLIVDEFASTLDRTTARNLARVLRRCASAMGLPAVVATSHDDVLEPLAPDLLVWQPLRGPAAILRETQS